MSRFDGAAASLAIVNDLLRTRASLVLVWLATRLLRLHPVSRHDGLLSVRRAYSADELGLLQGKPACACTFVAIRGSRASLRRSAIRRRSDIANIRRALLVLAGKFEVQCRVIIRRI